MWLCGFIEKLAFLPACDWQASLLISNAELQSKNVELGIRVLTQMVLQEDLGTKYQVQKKGCPEEQPFFMKVDSISSRTHQKSSSRSTWNLQ